MAPKVTLKHAGTSVGDTVATFAYQIIDLDAGPSGDFAPGDSALQSVDRAMQAYNVLPVKKKDFPKKGLGWQFDAKQITSIDSATAASGFVRYVKLIAAGEVTFRMGSIVRSVTTETDVDSKPIVVEYTGKDGTMGDPISATTNQFIPNNTLIVNHQTTNPPFSQLANVGKVNEKAWIGNVLGRIDVPDGAGQWLFHALELPTFNPRDLAESTAEVPPYNVQYTFVLDQDTFHPVVAAINPATGKQFSNNTKPDRIEPGQKGNGTLVVQTQKILDFGTLPFVATLKRLRNR